MRLKSLGYSGAFLLIFVDLITLKIYIMKKFILLLTIMLSLLIYSCSKSEDGLSGEKEECWVFTIKTVAKATYNGYSNTESSTTTVNKCGLTKSEAADTAKSMAGTSSTHGSGYSVTTTITVTYREQGAASGL